MIGRFFLRICDLSHIPIYDFVFKWINTQPNLVTGMNKKETLTHDEASLLEAFGNASEAFVPELAVLARLTPVEVDSAVDGLRQKALLIVEDKKKRFVRLTPMGIKARKSWPVLASESKPLRPRDLKSLDTALEETIKKLSR